MTEDEAFIRTIVDSPGDDLPRLVYADWLDERGDPRGAYLRAELEWAKAKQTTGFILLRLNGLAEGLDPVWVARVSRPPVGVCCDHLKFTGCGPRQAPSDLESLQHRLGLHFPAEFTAFLLNYNAGQVTPAGVAPADTPYAICDDMEWGFHAVGRYFHEMVAEFEQAQRLNSIGLPEDQAAGVE